MRLTVYSGSPRGRASNTDLLLAPLLRGYEATAGNSHELYHLRHPAKAAQASEAFGRAECVLLAFPLYTDAMPGRVMAFIENLAPYVGRVGNPPMAFMVHSGFPEAAHSRPLQVGLHRPPWCPCSSSSSAWASSTACGTKSSRPTASTRNGLPGPTLEPRSWGWRAGAFKLEGLAGPVSRKA